MSTHHNPDEKKRQKIPKIILNPKAGGPSMPMSMPGDLEDLLGGLPPPKPSNSSKPRYNLICDELGVNLVCLW